VTESHPLFCDKTIAIFHQYAYTGIGASIHSQVLLE